MANLRRHFNFNGKSSVSQESFSLPLSKSTFTTFDKLTLMNHICNCLDLCCSYVQALNSLCSAGSSLARNFYYTVRDSPAYQNISLQFLSVWDEVSKATAGASAAVKTETLMLLQEILNSLEMSTSEVVDETILNSFQAIGSCICSFIELQAQFSLSTWKSLSKLSKTFSNEPLKASLQWKSSTPLKLFINADLNLSIKKHYSQLFCKIGMPKVNEALVSSKEPFHLPTASTEADISAFHYAGEKNKVSGPSSESLWSSSIWSSKNYQGAAPQTELEEVINLLSCGPIEEFTDKLQNKSLIYPANSEQLNCVVSKSSQSASGSSSAWPKTVDGIKNESLCWRFNEHTPSSISLNPTINKSDLYENSNFFKQWQYNEIQMWNASLTETTCSSSDDVSSHCLEADIFASDKNKLYCSNSNISFKRGYHTGESMPGGLENVSEYGEIFLETQSKINTWPLKQGTNQDF